MRIVPNLGDGRARSQKRLFRVLLLTFCVGFSLWSAIVPFARATFRTELNYNEGWNVYQAATLAAHGELYPQKFGWTLNNYPMLSFALLAQLHKLTGEFLFTGRIVALLSLVTSCLLVGALVRRWTGKLAPAALGSFFCLALFCAAADYSPYVGTNEPQFLAHAIVLAGLGCWVASGRSRKGAVLAALLFSVGLSVKHNLLAAPLAVLFDALWLSWRRAAYFLVCCTLFVGIAFGLQIGFGGAYFLDQLLLPRSYSAVDALQKSALVLGPLAFPLAICIYEIWRSRRDPERRLAGLLFAASVILGCYFAGGSGVNVNSFFEALLAIALLAGLWIDRNWDSTSFFAKVAPAMLFAWLTIPWLIVPPMLGPDQKQDNWRPLFALREMRESERRFALETELLRRQPGPAICENLLLCYYAGKPFVYDPFNATRLIGQGKLDVYTMVGALQRRKLGAVQFDHQAEVTLKEDGERFASPIVLAVEANYQPALVNEDMAIYLPHKYR